MKYDVFIVSVPTGNVQLCGTVEAATPDEANDVARLMYFYDHNTEYLTVEEADAGSDV